ncbi:MAG: hypothetical protein AAB802_00225 [Patescibacteria group bacterium]
MKLSNLPLLLALSSTAKAEEPNRFTGYGIFPQMEDVRTGALQILTESHRWVKEKACPDVPTGEIVNLGQLEEGGPTVRFYQSSPHQIETRWVTDQDEGGFSITRAQKIPGFEVKTSSSTDSRCVQSAVHMLNVAIDESANAYTNCEITSQKENLQGLPTENPVSHPNAPVKEKSEFISLGIKCSN